jgi:hypothetical protein
MLLRILKVGLRSVLHALRLLDIVQIQAGPQHPAPEVIGSTCSPVWNHLAR